MDALDPVTIIIQIFVTILFVIENAFYLIALKLTWSEQDVTIPVLKIILVVINQNSMHLEIPIRFVNSTTIEFRTIITNELLINTRLFKGQIEILGNFMSPEMNFPLSLTRMTPSSTGSLLS